MATGNLDPMAAAEKRFRGTATLGDFADHRVIPLLRKLQSPTPYQTALFITYYRKQYWLMALEKLTHPKHFQPVLTATHATYEMLLDLKLLQADPAGADKFHEFVFVSRYDVAKNYIVALEANPAYVRPTPPEGRRAFVENPANRARYAAWPKGKSPHWSGMDMAARARQFGNAEEVRYRDVYALCNWFVHAGAAGIAEISTEGLTTAFAWGHAKIQELFAEATDLVCATESLYQADPTLKSDLALFHK
jgi:hypothetical protein